MATFKSNLKASLKANPPCLVAVENEEVGSPFVSGTASDYIGELKASSEVAHPMGLPVTNGGIVSGVSALLTWQDLFERSGKPAADDFARRAFVKPTQQKLLSNLLASCDGTLPPGPSADNLAKGKELVAPTRSCRSTTSTSTGTSTTTRRSPRPSATTNGPPAIPSSPTKSVRTTPTRRWSPATSRRWPASARPS
ncbi:MAG: hypothetical protein ACR2MB_03155 [Acidimicrobiales bacterium]